MKKLFTTSILIMILFSFSIVSNASAEDPTANNINVNITINEQKITSSNMRFKMLMVEDELYYPVSYDSLDAVGYTPNWVSKTMSIKLDVTEKKGFKDSSWIKVKLSNKYIETNTDVTLNGKSLSSENNPIYEINGVLYIPLNDTNLELLGWYLTWDKNIGLVIDTNSEESLDNYVNTLASVEDVKIAEFMQSVNSKLSKDEAMYYVKLINESCEKYDIDKLWFISMMWVESNFDTNCEYKGANGLMQIMTSTGRSLGLTKEQLYVPEHSIEFGAEYLKGNVDRYDGDIKKAVSAYNQGTRRVDSGSYSTWYVDVVKKRREKMKEYIKD